MAAVDLPCVVWVDIAPGSSYGPDPTFGLLVDRRPRVDQRGRTTWEGYVVTGKAADDRHGASVNAAWYPFALLTLVDAPRPPKRRPPPT
jgi:hypothetical protein